MHESPYTGAYQYYISSYDNECIRKEMFVKLL